MAAQSVSRRTEFEACPEEGLWTISLQDSEYRALTTPSQTLDLDSSHHLVRVRVRLDWDAGTLEFTNADTDTHLFTFRHSFAEMVYPYFESVSGGLAVSAQRVNVSTGSDYVPVEDADLTEEDQAVKGQSCTEGDVNTASANSDSKTSESGCLTEDSNSAIGILSEEKKPLKDELIKTKPSGKEKTKDKKQRRKPKFSVTYHVSLNKALNIINNESVNGNS